MAVKPVEAPAIGVYVTNEQSGDLSIIDAGTQVAGRHRAARQAAARHRGQPRPDDAVRRAERLAGRAPGVDEKTLPPPDRTADGIGVVDVRQQKLIKVLPSGTDPEAGRGEP